jgi:hypothetical protein
MSESHTLPLTLRCTVCGFDLEMHCCCRCGGDFVLDVQAPGEATLPRVEERLPDGSVRVLYESPESAPLTLLECAATMMVDRFERADRAVALQVEQDVYHSGTALAVLHQVADSLSDGDAALREEMLPEHTEIAAARRLPATDERIWP